mmetsp:Transcript_9843/g.21421  ORF Transcript_9843/g.21421 Transcript_9843/m.21421 type:complete len:212 (-) Transcript_9843:672-1307(-)
MYPAAPRRQIQVLSRVKLCTSKAHSPVPPVGARASIGVTPSRLHSSSMNWAARSCPTEPTNTTSTPSLALSSWPATRAVLSAEPPTVVTTPCRLLTSATAFALNSCEAVVIRAPDGIHPRSSSSIEWSRTAFPSTTRRPRAAFTILTLSDASHAAPKDAPAAKAGTHLIRLQSRHLDIDLGIVQGRSWRSEACVWSTPGRGGPGRCTRWHK